MVAVLLRTPLLLQHVADAPSRLVSVALAVAPPVDDIVGAPVSAAPAEHVDLDLSDAADSAHRAAARRQRFRQMRR